MLSLLFQPRRQTATFSTDVPGTLPMVTGGRFLFGGTTKAGVTVNEDTALTYSAFWCAARVICEAASMLPIFLYERTGTDERKYAVAHPLYHILKTAPNYEMTAMPFWEAATLAEFCWGNSFCEIERANYLDPSSDVVALWPIHPSRVQPIGEKDCDREGNNLYAAGYRYRVRNENSSYVVFRADEILHTPGVLTDDGIWGKSVVQYARESIGYGLAVEQHGSVYFAGGAQPPGVMEGAALKDPEQRKTFRKEWKEIHSPGSSEIALLPAGWKYTPIAISNEDSQFLGSQAWGVQNIARWTKVPAYMLADPTGVGVKASVEQAGIEFVVYCLMPWLIRRSQQINAKLLRPNERGKYYAEHLVDALQRGDSKTRMDAYRLAIMSGIRTLNEVRALENLNGIGPAGDVHYLPANMTTAQQMMSGGAKPGTAGPGSDATGVADDGQPSAVAVQESPIKAIEVLTAEFAELRRTLADPEPAMLPEPVTAPVQPALHGIASMVFSDALRRWRTKEANAAKRESKRSDFPAWLAKFHADNRVTLEETLTPAAAAISAAGRRVSAVLLAADVLVDSAASLCEAFETDTAIQFAARLDAWPAGSSEIARRIVGEPREPLQIEGAVEPTEREPDETAQKTLALLTQLVQEQRKPRVTRWKRDEMGMILEKIEG